MHKLRRQPAVKRLRSSTSIPQRKHQEKHRPPIQIMALAAIAVKITPKRARGRKQNGLF
jgi:hypothetical protein